MIHLVRDVRLPGCTHAPVRSRSCPLGPPGESLARWDRHHAQVAEVLRSSGQPVFQARLRRSWPWLRRPALAPSSAAGSMLDVMSRRCSARLKR